MKRIIFIFAILASCAFTGIAQATTDNKSDDSVFNAKMKELQERLLLSPQQTESVMPIYRNYTNEIKNLPKLQKKPASATEDEAYKHVILMLDRKIAILKIQEKYVGQLKSILNPNQLMQFLHVEKIIQAKIMGERTKRIRQNGHHGMTKDSKGKKN